MREVTIELFHIRLDSDCGTRSILQTEWSCRGGWCEMRCFTFFIHPALVFLLFSFRMCVPMDVWFSMSRAAEERMSERVNEYTTLTTNTSHTIAILRPVGVAAFPVKRIHWNRKIRNEAKPTSTSYAPSRCCVLLLLLPPLPPLSLLLNVCALRLHNTRTTTPTMLAQYMETRTNKKCARAMAQSLLPMLLHGCCCFFFMFHSCCCYCCCRCRCVVCAFFRFVLSYTCLLYAVHRM